MGRVPVEPPERDAPGPTAPRDSPWWGVALWSAATYAMLQVSVGAWVDSIHLHEYVGTTAPPPLVAGDSLRWLMAIPLLSYACLFLGVTWRASRPPSRSACLPAAAPGKLWSWWRRCTGVP